MSLVEASRVLARGGTVVYPTDTLWGLGARISDARAVAKVYQAKGRPTTQGLPVALEEVGDLERYGVLTPLARKLARLLPGPLTLVVERKSTVPAWVTGGADSVALRVPDHAGARALLARAGPLTATSANRHGSKDPVTVEEARAQLGDRADYYLAEGSAPLGVASTLVDVRGATPMILRVGAVSEDDIRGCLTD